MHGFWPSPGPVGNGFCYPSRRDHLAVPDYDDRSEPPGRTAGIDVCVPLRGGAGSRVSWISLRGSSISRWWVACGSESFCP